MATTPGSIVVDDRSKDGAGVQQRRRCLRLTTVLAFAASLFALSENARVRDVPRPSVLFAIGIALVAVWFAGIDQRALQHPDEGRYAEISREMLASGEYVLPRLNGLVYVEKPPLQYWITAGAYRIFGVHEWTARLWPVLSTLLSIGFLGYVGARVGGTSVGVYTIAVTVGNVGYVIASHVLTLDGSLTAWLTVTFGAFLLAQQRDIDACAQRMWMWVAWIAAAGATLTKGPVAVLIPTASLVLYSILTRDLSPWRRLHGFSGLAIFLGLVAPWFVAAARENDEFLRFFFVHEHFTRYLATEHHRAQPWWFFVAVLLSGGVPWITGLLSRMPLLWRDGARGSSFSWQRFALVWSAFVFAFFSFSSSKLATYIMPMLPPLALLGGTILDRLDARAMRRLLLPLAVTTTLLLAALLPGYDALVSRFARAPELIEPLKAFRFCLIGGIAAIAAGSAAAIAMLHRGNAYRALAIATVSAATVIAGQTFLIGFDAFRPLRSAKDLLSSAAERAPLMADAPFFQVELYDQTLPFYLRRTTTLVGYRDEFTFGIAAEPDKQIPTIDAFVPRWRALKDGYALVRPATFERFEREGIPMRVLAREPKRILVSRR